jgi:uncharacterized membrane protein
MFDRKRVRKGASNAAGTVMPIAEQLTDDPKLRRRLIAALAHAELARRQARRATGFTGAAMRLASDREFREHLQEIAVQLQDAQRRVKRRQSHKVRNTMLLALGGGAVAAMFHPKVRERLGGVTGTVGSAMPSGGPTTIEEQIEVGVPVSTAYNQWTQFEDFPLFMEGVDHVDQLGDTELHWVASIGGKRAEWDAKIIEQQPDTRISWSSIDGRHTHGTVWFEKLGENRTLVRLAMTYRPQGPVELAGSAAGVDRRRIKGDLERFRELIESRGAETGAWRGEIESGTKTG